jgi:hypothetical protein
MTKGPAFLASAGARKFQGLRVEWFEPFPRILLSPEYAN